MRLPLLILHICAGTLGMLSGFVAVFFRKGSRSHATAGNTFVISMLILAASGTYLAIMKSQPGNILGGTLTFYLVATAWLTARRKNKEEETSIFDWGALLVVSTVAAFDLTYGVEAAYSPTGLKFDYPPGPYFSLAPWPCLQWWGTFACSCAAALPAHSVSRGICGACVLRCSSPHPLYSWHGSNYSQPCCARRVC